MNTEGRRVGCSVGVRSPLFHTPTACACRRLRRYSIRLLRRLLLLRISGGFSRLVPSYVRVRGRPALRRLCIIHNSCGGEKNAGFMRCVRFVTRNALYVYTQKAGFSINPTGASQQSECAPGGLCIYCTGVRPRCLCQRLKCGPAGAVALFSVRCPAVPVSAVLRPCNCRFGLSCSVILLQRRNPFTRKNT